MECVLYWDAVKNLMQVGSALILGFSESVNKTPRRKFGLYFPPGRCSEEICRIDQSGLFLVVTLLGVMLWPESQIWHCISASGFQCPVRQIEGRPNASSVSLSPPFCCTLGQPALTLIAFIGPLLFLDPKVGLYPPCLCFCDRLHRTHSQRQNCG